LSRDYKMLGKKRSVPALIFTMGLLKKINFSSFFSIREII